MKWFNSLPHRKRDKYGDFFLNENHFPRKADGEDLARMKEEHFVALLGEVLGASLYEELQPLKAKGAPGPPFAFLHLHSQRWLGSALASACCS